MYPLAPHRFIEHNVSAGQYFAQFPLIAPGDDPLRGRCSALPKDIDGNIRNEIHVQAEATPRCVRGGVCAHVECTRYCTRSKHMLVTLRVCQKSPVSHPPLSLEIIHPGIFSIPWLHNEPMSCCQIPASWYCCATPSNASSATTTWTFKFAFSKACWLCLCVFGHVHLACVLVRTHCAGVCRDIILWIRMQYTGTLDVRGLSNKDIQDRYVDSLESMVHSEVWVG